ncbi:MAG TPA: hypothetical protein VNF73_00415 [Candidatus Saccharimonadales bacterium]|nr:hypothetical protein [Candidatus Saccharimonadales bacterium]
MTVQAASATSVPADRRARLSAFQEARGRAGAWLLAHLNSDGSMGDPRQGYHFYRAPWTFSLLGETEAASAVCGWIRRNMLTRDGRIDGPFRVFSDAWAYRDSALIVGAQMAGQYDLSHGLMPELLRWQDPVSGGYANDRMADGSMGDDQSIPYAAGPGFACLATGHLVEARAVYHFLRRIFEAQRSLPDRFYYDWSRARQAPTIDFEQERRFWYVVENQADLLQRWTIGGIAAGFLCRLYLAEPVDAYLALARQYQAFSMSATDAQFKYGPVCKSGWGSSLLYEITGEPGYEAWTYRMGDWFAAEQHPDGYWPIKGDGAELGNLIHNALEFAMHVDTIIAGLTSRPIPDAPAA